MFTPVIRVGELEIDIVHRWVRVDGHDLQLTPLELSLLCLLAANAGQVLTRDEILDSVWGSDYAAESNLVDHHVRNLRAKLQDDWRRRRYGNRHVRGRQRNRAQSRRAVDRATY